MPCSFYPSFSCISDRLWATRKTGGHQFSDLSKQLDIALQAWKEASGEEGRTEDL